MVFGSFQPSESQQLTVASSLSDAGKYAGEGRYPVQLEVIVFPPRIYLA